MPRKDSIHQSVKNALIKDGWTITNDPLVLKYGDEDMFVDLGAERLLGAERGADKIAVEIKSFTGFQSNATALTQLHNALGQYQMYLAVLEKVKLPRRKRRGILQNAEAVGHPPPYLWWACPDGTRASGFAAKPPPIHPTPQAAGHSGQLW